MQNTISTVDTVSLGEPIYVRVRERIRQEILAGVFEPGTRLKIADLSNRYKVSQMPIREALQQLQGEGLVIIEPNKGAIVKRVDDRFITNLYDIRGAIEVLLVRLAIPALNGKSIQELQAIQKKYIAASNQQDIASTLFYNKLFHSTIYHMADNPEAISIIDRHWGLLDGLRRKYGFGQSRFDQVIEEHEQLIDAFVHQDSEKAENIARIHSEHAKHDLLNQKKQFK